MAGCSFFFFTVFFSYIRQTCTRAFTTLSWTQSFQMFLSELRAVVTESHPSLRPHTVQRQTDRQRGRDLSCLSFFYKAKVICDQDPHLGPHFTLSPSRYITLVVRASACEFWGHSSAHSRTTALLFKQK